MWAESAGPGQGSSFHFTIRALPAALLQGTRRDFFGTQPQLSGKRILVVDDNATNRRILALQTAKWGMVVHDTEDPARALAMLKAQPFDLAIVDMHMPGMDGATLALRIRERGHSLPLVLFSSLGRREASDSVFAATLAKPLRQSQLFDTLAGLLAVDAPRPTTAAAKPRMDAGMAARHPLRILPAEDHGGVVNQMIGDGLLAIFGAPLPLSDHAACAVRAALEMIEMIELFNLDRVAAAKSPIKIGVGIASGEMVAGYTGTQSRATYTCIGDTVNLAARLEAHTKVARRTILIDAATRAALAEGVPVDAVGAVQFSGKAAPVEVFSVRVTG